MHSWAPDLSSERRPALDQPTEKPEGARQSGQHTVKQQRMPLKRGQHLPARGHFRTERRQNPIRIVLDRAGRGAFACYPARAQRVRNALAAPRLQKSRGVSGDQHRPASQG